ncbi:MAG: hypothetical protein U0821_25975 [Chloroflexota bacterium]
MSNRLRNQGVLARAVRRRGVLGVLGAAVAGLAAGAVRPEAAEATGGNMIAGGYNDAVGTTTTLVRWNNTPNQGIVGLYVQNHNSSSAAVVGESVGSNTGPGVQGLASSGWGVHGNSTSSYGVVGGTQGSTAGVFGNGLYGVYGVSSVLSNAGFGVIGAATAGNGVYGQASGNNGTYGNGVTGLATQGNGVYASASDGGVGVRTDSQYGHGLYATSAYGIAGHFIGTVSVIGNFSVSGTKSAVVPHPDGSHRKVFCLESPLSYFEDFGHATLVDGAARIRIDADFAALVRAERYEVFLTPNGDCRGLYVAEKDADGFTVRELQGGTSTLDVSYRVVAERGDVSTRRLEAVELPEPLPPVALEPLDLSALPVVPMVPPASPRPAGGTSPDGAARAGRVGV